MKSVKNLIVPSIILLFLAVFAIVYFAVESFRSRNTIETDTDSVKIVSYESSEIASVIVHNNATGYNSKVVRTANSDGTDKYEFSGDDFDPSEKYSEAKLADYVEYMTNFFADSKVSSNGNFADFGLDNPRITVTINTVAGETVVVNIGNDSPDGNYAYANVSGSNDIYTIYSTKVLIAQYSSVSFLDEMSLNIGYNDIKSVHFERKSDGLSLDATVSISESGISVFDIYEPYVHQASGYFGNLIDGIAHLTITEFVDTNTSDLSGYGLADPAYRFVFTKISGGTIDISFSRMNEGYCFGYIKGINKIFAIYDYQLDGANLQELVLIDPYVCYCYVKDIKFITGKYGDQSFKFELDVPNGKNITSDNSTVTLDGRNAKVSDSYGRAYYSILFESIACIKIGGIEMNPTSAGTQPEITLSFQDKNYNTTVYDFYKRDENSYYVYKDGEYMHFYVYAEEIFNDGGTDTYNYGFWKAYELLSKAITENMNGIYDL